jgi:hypothetical protein
MRQRFMIDVETAFELGGRAWFVSRPSPSWPFVALEVKVYGISLREDRIWRSGDQSIEREGPFVTYAVRWGPGATHCGLRGSELHLTKEGAEIEAQKRNEDETEKRDKAP